MCNCEAQEKWENVHDTCVATYVFYFYQTHTLWPRIIYKVSKWYMDCSFVGSIKITRFFLKSHDL